jgi:hypothetical protein
MYIKIDYESLRRRSVKINTRKSKTSQYPNTTKDSTINYGSLRLDYNSPSSTTNKIKVWSCPTVDAKCMLSFRTIYVFFHSTQPRRKRAKRNPTQSGIRPEKSIWPVLRLLHDTLSKSSTPGPPTPSHILTISLHHDDPLRPPSLNLPLSTPKRASKTLNNIQTPYVHQHPPTPFIYSRAKLNSLNCLTPSPPYSLCKQIVFQLIQEIFLKPSLPPRKN